MSFNHYAKLKRILDAEPPGWVIHRINEPTQAKNFKGETTYFDHYYRVFRENGEAIPYCKFQQIERFAQAVGLPVEALPIIE